MAQTLEFAQGTGTSWLGDCPTVPDASLDLLQGLCCEVSERNLHFKTLQEDAVMATGKSTIEHHQTITNKPHRYFQRGLVGGDTHQTEFLTAFVSHRAASGEGSASFLIPSPSPS